MKFSIVTPTYNSGKYLTETIKSVISQKGNFEIEYIIVDGESNDNTINIVKKYDELIKNNQIQINCNKVKIKWVSEKDNGMYDAINKGFSMATGDIFAWLNSDDIYLPGAFQIIKKTLKKYPEINWLKGITLISDEKLKTIKKTPCYIFNQKWIKRGIYGRNAYFIHQDSVFWRKELWNKKGEIDKNLKLAGDYYLWIKFAEQSPLWSLNQPISRFRKRRNQLSEDMNNYRKEQKRIKPEQKDFLTFKIKLFFWSKSKLPSFLKSFFILLYKFLFWKKNEYYINIENKEPVKRKINSFEVK
jgi:glycosyltransferase involved in cell wall biosynthesis